MVRTSQDGTELGLLREGQISFLGEGGGGWWGGFKKKVVWDWGGEKDYEAASPADPNGEGRVSPSRGIWHNPPESMESLCVVLILFNHTSELRNKKGKEKQPPGEHLPCVQVCTDALYGFAPLIPQHTTRSFGSAHILQRTHGSRIRGHSLTGCCLLGDTTTDVAAPKPLMAGVARGSVAGRA